jgi:peptidoglycan/LPS O-acetylase OafA/YrhL
MQSKNIGYLEKLDHLRLFAVLLVLMFHAEIVTGSLKTAFQVPMFHQGHTGVTTFMVISGMILAMIAYGKELSIWRFYVNRVLRIYPLLVVVVALGYFSTKEGRDTAATIDFLTALLPVSNLSRKYGEFGGPLWSIAVELQFYLVFPFLIAAIDRIGDKFAWAVVGLMILLRGAVFLLHGTVHHLAYLTIFGNIDAFVIGVLAGRLYMRRELSFPAWAPLVALLLVNVLIYVAFLRPFAIDYAKISTDGVSNSRSWIIWPTVQGLLWAAFILAYLCARLRLPFSRFFAELGKYSYSIYAWHTLVMLVLLKYPQLTAPFLQLPGFPAYWLCLVLIFPLSVALAALSYHVIEAPFLAMRVKYVSGRANTPEGVTKP